MNYWLFKSEPDEFGIDDLRAEPDRSHRWDGIRNYQARNLLRDQVAVGDLVLIYHSSCATVGVAGVAEVVCGAYPDPAQFDPKSPYYDPKATAEAPRWVCVDIRFGEKFERVIPLAQIKRTAGLEEMVLLRQGRLSVQPVTAEQWSIIQGLR